MSLPVVEKIVCNISVQFARQRKIVNQFEEEVELSSSFCALPEGQSHRLTFIGQLASQLSCEKNCTVLLPHLQLVNWSKLNFSFFPAFLAMHCKLLKNDWKNFFAYDLHWMRSCFLPTHLRLQYKNSKISVLISVLNYADSLCIKISPIFYIL